MAVDNVKTVFRLPSGVNKEFIRNFIYLISTNSNKKVFRNIHSKKHVLKSRFDKVPGLQPAALSIKGLQTGVFL